MDGHHLIAWLLIGLIAGAIAGRIVEGGGFGVLGDVVVGLIGAFLGGIILHSLTGSSTAGGFLVECLVALAGAVVLLLLLRALGRGRQHEHGLLGAFRR